MAGSMKMRFIQFFPFDAGGALLYAVVWAVTGFLFSGFIARLSKGYEVGSRILLWILAFLVVVYFGYKLFRLLRAGPLSYVPSVSPSEVARRFYSDLYDDLAVFDVRSHGYYSEKASRIKGSIRLEPNAIVQQMGSLPKDKELILYCTCLSEATSIRVARILQQHGFRSAVIKGGLRAWKRAGYALETVPAEDVFLLPTF
jgi:rhodanese-related sulfurtransferase